MIGVDTQMAIIGIVGTLTRSEVGTQLALRTELKMIGNQIVDPGLGPDPLDLLHPNQADNLALLNVYLEIPKAEVIRLADVPLSHIAAQVNALAQTACDVAATHVCLIDVLLPGRDPSFDEPVLDGS
jgi:hypothetical protein